MRAYYLQPAALCIALSLYLNTQAQTTQKYIDAKIEKATVFLNGAQINRSGKTPVPQGTSEIVFKNISPYVNKQSIQLTGDGPFTILGVVHKLNYMQEQTRQAELQRLQEQKEMLQEKAAAETDMLNIYINEEGLLEKNQAIVAQNTGLKTSDLREAADFHRQRLTEIKLKKTEINKRLKKINEEVTKIIKQENEIGSQANNATSEIIVTVQSKEATNGNFKLSYLVDKAGWYPTYDVRVKDISSPITLAYKANIYQSSGEDWKDVKLTLSTANPNQNGEKPSLPVWQLRYFTPQLYGTNSSPGIYNPNVRQVTGRVTDQTGGPLAYATVMLKGTKQATVTDASGNFAINIPYSATTLVLTAIGFQSREIFVTSTNMNIAMESNTNNLSEVVVVGYGARRNDGEYYDTDDSKRSQKEKSIPLTIAERENITSFSFEIETPYTILNDGKLATVEMKTTEVPALYEYYCVPKLETDVFLTAKIIDWNDLNLLEGESNIIFEGTYIGKAVLNPKTAGDTLSISLGRDKNIQVKRLALKEFSKKQLLGSNKVDYRTFEITVRNNKKQAIQLIVEDQYPVSAMKEVEVEQIEHKEATLSEATGTLKWTIALDAGKEKKVQFKYSVKYPKSQSIVLN
jgi:hypothetical protein